MIYCPICGTANRDGSKFCNECGIKFDPHMQVKCPQCGTLNPATDAACHDCGASLVSPPEPTPQGSDMPAGGEGDGPSPPEEMAGVPAWLIVAMSTTR